MNILKRAIPAFILAIIVLAGCKKEQYDFDSLPELVKSYFTVPATDVYHINQTISFTNASENAQDYSWDFGDGTTSTEKDPQKSFTNPGLYNVKLTAVGKGGTGRYAVDVAVIDPDAVVETDKELYFIEYSTSLVRKVSLVPGSTVETVIDMTGKEAHSMAYDAVNEKIYYCDFETTNAGKIWRMNADGSDLEEILSGLGSPYGIALNLADGKMYIADGANVSRANLDGSGYEKSFITRAGGALRAIGYNNTTSQIFFYEVNDEDLYSANKDGSGATAIVAGAYGYGLFVDEVNGKIYYDDRNEGAMMRANLDGTGVIKIASFSGNRGGSGMTIDYESNKLFWSETNLGNIKRANLDGSEAETLLSGVKNPRGMFIK